MPARKNKPEVDVNAEVSPNTAPVAKPSVTKLQTGLVRTDR